MKKSRILLVAVALLTVMGLTSCEKTADKILGSWELTSMTIIDNEDFDIELEGSIWTFNADNTFSIMGNGEIVGGTYSVKDEQLVARLLAVYSEESEELNFIMDVSEITDSKMTLEGEMKLTVTEGDETYSDRCLASLYFKKK